MKYLDAPGLTKEWLDHYYLHEYKTDDEPFSAGRLESLAVEVSKRPHAWRVCDIGGTDGKLKERLVTHGMQNVRTAGVGDEIPESDIVILSHTLEHVHDVRGLMRSIRAKLRPGGFLFVEVPIWLEDATLEYDRHWQHINKFMKNDIERLLELNKFTVVKSERLPDYREYHTWRVIGRYA